MEFAARQRQRCWQHYREKHVWEPVEDVSAELRIDRHFRHDGLYDLRCLPQQHHGDWLLDLRSFRGYDRYGAPAAVCVE
ncbi:hypothetical protein D3C86_1874090 [compost metagenome]